MRDWFGVIEGLAVFGLVLGWGLWELRKFRAYKDEDRGSPDA